MANKTSERLRQLNDKIMKTWEDRAVSEVHAALHENSLALRDSLPEFLRQIADALSTTINRTAVRIKWDRDESSRVGRKHGRERAGTLNYTMDQLIFEYHILRQVICEVMEDETPLTLTEREIIVCAVEQAVNDAATEYAETFRDIHERFTNTLAHDLRSSITATKLGAQMILRKSEDSESCRKIATQISQSMERIDLMIYDLLDASRLRAGEVLKLTLETCDLNLIAEEMGAESNLLKEDRIKLVSPGKIVVQSNEIALRRIIDNLLTNALKFSNSKSLITLTLEDLGQSVNLSVHNVGVPISEDEITILFEQFRRSRNSEGKMGWGLGLTVVKGLVMALGGTIKVESSLSRGTVFSVNLPEIAQ